MAFDPYDVRLLGSDDVVDCCEVYRNRGLHVGQSPERLALVRGEIDRICEITSAQRLFEIVADRRWSPEARALAAARCEAAAELSRQRRDGGVDIDIELLRAHAVNAVTRRWRSRDFYCSMATSCGTWSLTSPGRFGVRCRYRTAFGGKPCWH